MFWIRVLFLFGLSIFVTNCAIHPLPDDVTRDTTLTIVKKIRCEAKLAMKKALQADPKFAKNYKLNKNYIGYDFKFTITENNKGSGKANFTLPFSDGKFTLGLGFGKDKARQSERNFRLVESFQELLDHKHKCLYKKSPRQWQYPITGNVGFEEVVRTYLGLYKLGRFRADKKDNTLSTFSDKLTFTTMYNGNVDPKIEINPVSNNFKLTEASASLGADRKDVHELTIAIITAESKVVSREYTSKPESDPRKEVLRELDRQRDLQFRDNVNRLFE